MIDLLKASILTWIGTAAIMLAALIRGKVVAVELGPAGVGTIAQIVVFIHLLKVVGTLSLGSGVSQNIAKYIGERDQEDVNRIVQTTILVVGFIGLLISLCILFFAPQISKWLFHGDQSQAQLLVIVALGIVAICLDSNFQSILTGYGAVSLSSITDIFTAITTVLFSIVLVKLWNINGAVLALVLVYIMRVISQLAGIGWKYPETLRRMPRYVDRRAISVIFINLLRIAAASILMAGSGALAQLIVRSNIIRLYGVETNGLYQAAFAASTLVIVSGVAFLTSYAFSRVNSETNQQERVRRTNQVFHLAILIVVLGISLLILFRNVYTSLLLSPEFLPAGQYFGLQAAGEGLYQLGLTIGLGMLLTAGIKIWMGAGLFWGISNALLGVILLPLGKWALPLPYFVSALLYFFLSWGILARSDKFVLTEHNRTSLLLAAIMLVFLNWLPISPLTIFIGIICLSLWYLFALGQYRQVFRERINQQILKMITKGA